MTMQWQAQSVIKVVFRPLLCFHWFWLRKERQQLGWSKSEICSFAKKQLPYKTSLHTALQSADTGQGHSYFTSFVFQEEKGSNPPTNSSRVNFLCSFGSNEDSKGYEFDAVLPISVMTPYQIWVIQGTQLPNTVYIIAYLKSKVVFTVWQNVIALTDTDFYTLKHKAGISINLLFSPILKISVLYETRKRIIESSA